MNLAELLYPILPSHFLIDNFTKRAIYIKGAEDKFSTIFGYHEFNRVLNSGRSPLPSLKLVKDGQLLPVEDSIGLLKAVQLGASLIIDDIDQYSPDLKLAITNISREIGEPVQANLYFSQPDNAGFHLHYDTHDVFILQIVGYKAWRIFEPSMQFPLWAQKKHGRDIPSEPYLKVDLKPGDFLYVPRGHWHDAIAHDEASLHITVGINSRTAIDYLTWLVNELREETIFRQEFLPSADRSIDAALKNSDFLHRIGTLKDRLGSAFESEDMLQSFQTYCRAAANKSFVYDFPLQLASHTIQFKGEDVLFRNAGQQIDISVSPTDGTVEIAVEERLYRFNSRAETLLRRLFTSVNIRYQEICTPVDISHDEINEILTVFIRDGVMRWTPGTTAPSQ